MKEIYKDIPGYNGMYQISNIGNVKSKKFLKERILKNRESSTEYLCVSLCIDSKCKQYCIHTLMAITFLNHIPNGYNIVVDHKDNNRRNNNLDNLQLITQRLNSSKNKTNKTSQYTGVSWSKQNLRWVAQAHANGGQKHIGYFKKEYEAHLAYQKKIVYLKKPNLN